MSVQLDRHETHEVVNQSIPLEGYNAFAEDRVLVEALRREGAGWAEERALEVGALAGSARAIRWGFEANENPPVLKTHDRFGHRIDEVEFHPAWHELMRAGVAQGLHALPWRAARPGAHVARAALFVVLSQVEAGHGCPISMTYAVLPALRKQAEVAKEWEPKITSTQYDSRFRPFQEKTGVIFGMAMTEKQGGSDLRANLSEAVPFKGSGPGAEYLLTGHKWFCSAPMSDAFLVLARAEGGLSCFLLPRWTPEGKRNKFFIQRLKDKMGNRSNASGEVEFEGAWARMVGPEGRGIPIIIEMTNHTRLDCALGSAGLMRQGLVQALHHSRHREAFGKKLIDQSLMENVLADMAVESEAATVLVMRLARAFDRQQDKNFEDPFRRIATAVSKYWLCKRAPNHTFEALECLGGNGFVEEFLTARLYREAPVNSVWEGSGNVICLDVLRAMNKEPQSTEALKKEIDSGLGSDPRLDAFVKTLWKDLPALQKDERQFRQLVERLALALQGSLLVRHSPNFISEAFCASRLSGEWGKTLGTLPSSVDFKKILERSWSE